MDNASLAQFHQLLDSHFNEEELRTLCFQLHLDYDSLGGRGKTANARELILLLARTGRLAELPELVKAQRPHVAWPELNNVTGSLTAPPASAWIQHCQKTIDRLSAPRYQLDQRFVQLTLLVDQGPDARDVRFVPDGQRKRYDSLATLLQESEERLFVLLGRPGSGKTTLLHRLQLECAWEELTAASGQVVFFGELNLYRSERPGESPPEPLTWLAHEWAIRYPNLPDFTTAFHQGRCLLLLDGLNEIPHHDKTDYQERIGRWQAFLQRFRHAGNTILFSCRSLDYSAFLSSEAAPVRQVQVEPLSPPQIEAFLTLHLAEQGPSVWTALEKDRERLELFSTPFFLRLLVDEVAATGQIPTGQAELLTGFVRRALRREVGEHHHHLFMPGALLSDDDVQQVEQGFWATPFDLPEDGPLMPKLAGLAFGMQDGREGKERSQVRISEAAAREWLAHPQAREMVEAGIQLNVLDKDLARREITFYHQLLQEYFAARVLAQKPDPARLHVPWRADEVVPSLAETVAGLAVSDPLPPLPATGWEETAMLAAAMTPNQEQFVRDLIPPNLPLAARCAAAPEVRVSPAMKQQLQQALLARIADPQADLRARIVTAEALGELGDPRFVRRDGPLGAYLQPPMVTVPGGRYTLGDDQSQYDGEKPAHPVEIAPFEMGVFPVTNAEYGLFVEAGGYEEERWWETEAAQAWRKGEGSNEGPKQAARDQQKYLQGFSEEVIRGQQVSPDQIEFWLWLRNVSSEELERQYEEWHPAGKVYQEPRFWEDSRFNHASRPVVGVCWFEARAYCAWLSAQTGENYGLPTEAEWEAAARGQAGRVYPYGNTYDAAHCNTFETHIRGTTPVGVFPGGQTPEGIADLSGNVWEWTTTLWGNDFNRPAFSYPYVADDGRENLADGAARRVVRGGSWDFNQNYARGAYRNHYHPVVRYDFRGFRVVRRPPSPGH